MSLTRNPWLISLAAFAFALSGAACADDPTGLGEGAQDAGCAPMTSRACPCEIPGETGTRTCLGSGRAWSDCVCQGDGFTDVSPDDAPGPSSLEPGFRTITPLTATGQLSSPNYRLRLHVGPPVPSETLISPHYQLTLGAPDPIH